MKQITAAAHPSLAFVKYWGKLDAQLNIPTNASIGVNLSGATTTTSVSFNSDLKADVVTINGQAASRQARDRVVRHLDRVRALASIQIQAVVKSENDFPADAGIASSSSAFAALSLAATLAAGLALDEKQLSILARKGSGSACRAVPSGFVEWVAGSSDDDSFAYQLAPADHWDITITTVVIDQNPKEISSSQGHRAALDSPFFQTRLQTLPHTLDSVRRALLARDFNTFGMLVEREAVSMHMTTMTAPHQSRDWLGGIYYWQPETLHLILAIQEWRRKGLPVYFTIDAGPNLHLVCESKDQTSLVWELDLVLSQLGGNYLVSKPGRGAWVLESD